MRTDSFHGLRDSESGPVFLRPDGFICLGWNKAESGKWEKFGQVLILRWPGVAPEILYKTEWGFLGHSLLLAPSKAFFGGFWPGFNPQRSGLRAFCSHPVSVASVWGHPIDQAELDRADYTFSGEAARVVHDGHRFQWEFQGRQGSCRRFIGVPYVPHPDALHFPLFYERWQQMAEKTRPSPPRRTGITFLTGNTRSGGLAERRLALAVYLAQYFTVAAPSKIRHCFPEGSKAEFYDVPDKTAFLSRFRYNLCFENHSAPGYLTEKLFDSFYAGAVPLYAGDPDAGNYFDADGFLNCMDLEPEAVADRIADLERSKLPGEIEVRREGFCRIPLEDMMDELDRFLKVPFAPVLRLKYPFVLKTGSAQSPPA